MIKSNYIKALSLVFIMILAIQYQADAQVRTRKTTESTTSTKTKKEAAPSVSLMDKINPEIRFGNLGFFNGFAISTKLNVGYKLSDRFSAGVGGKLFFNQYLGQGSAPDPSFLDLGALIYARGKITSDIYIQAEYATMSFDLGTGIPKVKTSSPLIGAGYLNGVGKWRFGIELLYITDSSTRRLQNSVVEYWFGASYNF